MTKDLDKSHHRIIEELLKFYLLKNSSRSVGGARISPRGRHTLIQWRKISIQRKMKHVTKNTSIPILKKQMLSMCLEKICAFFKKTGHVVHSKTTTSPGIKVQKWIPYRVFMNQKKYSSLFKRCKLVTTFPKLLSIFLKTNWDYKDISDLRLDIKRGQNLQIKK